MGGCGNQPNAQRTLIYAHNDARTHARTHLSEGEAGAVHDGDRLDVLALVDLSSFVVVVIVCGCVFKCKGGGGVSWERGCKFPSTF